MPCMPASWQGQAMVSCGMLGPADLVNLERQALAPPIGLIDDKIPAESKKISLNVVDQGGFLALESGHGCYKGWPSDPLMLDAAGGALGVDFVC